MCWVNTSGDMQMFVDMGGYQLVVSPWISDVTVIVRGCQSMCKDRLDVMHNRISVHYGHMWMWSRCTGGRLSICGDIGDQYVCPAF